MTAPSPTHTTAAPAHKKNPWVRVGVTLALIAVGIFLLFRQMAADDARKTAEAPVTIVSSSPSDEGSGTDVVFSWTVAGETHKGTDSGNLWFKNVTSYKVCYEPDNPKAGSLEPGDRTCGK